MAQTTETIQIRKFESAYAKAFRALNEAWISSYFEMEPDDYKVLDHPEEYILKKGGEIFVAVSGTTVVGVCAVLPADRPGMDYELAKMAVDPECQGKGVGFMLGTAVIGWVKAKGAQLIFLDSNTRLKPAILLYRKLGFKEVSGIRSPYRRTDIQMVLDLSVE